MGQNKTKAYQTWVNPRVLIQPQEVNSNPTQEIFNFKESDSKPLHQTQFMCGHIIHEEKSKLVYWGVHKPRHLHQLEKGGYTRIYKRSYIIILRKFLGVETKISIEETLWEMGVTKPSVTSQRSLQNHQRGSINKWTHPLLYWIFSLWLCLSDPHWDTVCVPSTLIVLSRSFHGVSFNDYSKLYQQHDYVSMTKILIWLKNIMSVYFYLNSLSQGT